MSLNFNELDLRNKIIVIVEDDIPSVKYYETVLINTGAVLRIFSNGKEFIDYILNSGEKPDLVFIDFLIPFVNGIESVRILRRNNRSVPVVMITAYFSEQTGNEALIAGCNEYVLKPVFPEKIFCLLEKYLRHQAAFSAVN
jgi:CheY-like chemotaxis protein